MGTLNWVQVGRSLTWQEAASIAGSVSGTLYDDLTLPADKFMSRLAQAGPKNDANEDPAWVGAHHVAGGWAWSNGSAVAIAKFAPGSVNADADPGNDSAYVALEDNVLVDATDRPVASFIMEQSGSSISGTAYADWYILGGATSGHTIKMMAGDDVYTDFNDSGFGPFVGGGTVDGGSGNDVIDIEGDGFSTAIDGTGHDIVLLANGLLKATSDGESDVFQVSAGRVSYASAKQDIVATPGSVFSTEIGHDEVYTPELVGGSGNDTISGFLRIQGGNGNDTLAPIERAEGGNGNDILIANSPSRVDLRGEAGDDTLMFYTGASVSGGAGNDHFVFKQVAPVTINDLTRGDTIDLSALLDVSVHDAFSQGYLQTAAAGGYTSLLYDEDGGGDDLALLLSVKGVYSSLGDFIVT